MVKVRFKKIIPEAVIPTKAHPTDAGFDLVAVSKSISNEIISYGFGLAVEIPAGYVGLIFPRSSVYKKDLALTNCVGVIDSSFRGEISAKFRIQFPNLWHYDVGDRIAQMIILPYPEIDFVEVDELMPSDRGEGGYGSTGR